MQNFEKENMHVKKKIKKNENFKKFLKVLILNK